MARRIKDDENTPRERDEFLDALGARVKAARLSRNLTQRELAAKLGAGPSWVHLLEDGQQNAQIQSLRRMAEVLGVPLQSLIPPYPALQGSEALKDGDESAASALAEASSAISTLNATVGTLNNLVGHLHRINAVQTRR